MAKTGAISDLVANAPVTVNLLARDGRRFGVLLLWVIPLFFPIAVFALVARNGVDVPYMDEWLWAKLSVDVNHANPVALAWAFQDNEHRVVFPSLIALGLSRLGGYDPLREMFFSVIVVVLTQIAMLRLIDRTIRGIAAPVVFFTGSLVLFGLGQSENWLAGFQITWFLINYLVVVLTSLLATSHLSWARLVAAAGIAFLASFSAAFGLVTLAVGFLTIVARERPPLLKLGVWSAFSIAVIALYVSGMREPAGVAPRAFASLVSYVEYFFAFMGAPLCAWAGIAVSAWCGIVLVLVATALTIAAYAMKRAAAVPWIGLACYGIACGILTSYGRVDALLAATLPPRYTTSASTTWIGVAGILAIVLGPALRTRLGRYSGPAAGTALVLFTLAMVPQEVHGLADMHDDRISHEVALGVVEHFHDEPLDALTIAYPVAAVAGDVLQVLERDGPAPFLTKTCP